MLEGSVRIESQAQVEGETVGLGLRANEGARAARRDVDIQKLSGRVPRS